MFFLNFCLKILVLNTQKLQESSVKSGSKNVEKEDDIVLIKDSSRGPKLKREVHWPEGQHEEAYTSLRVSKTHKEVLVISRILTSPVSFFLGITIF